MMDSFLIVWILFRESISDKNGKLFGACFLFSRDVDLEGIRDYVLCYGLFRELVLLGYCWLFMVLTYFNDNDISVELIEERL